MENTQTFSIKEFRKIASLEKDEIFDILSTEINRLHGIIAIYEHHINALIKQSGSKPRKHENYTD